MADIPALPPHAAEVLTLLGFPTGVDATDSIMWRTDHDPIRIYLVCSDTFWWATADVEEVTPDDMPLLRECHRDLTAINPTSMWLPELYAARKRHLRPMRAVLDRFRDSHPDEIALLEAAGPEPDPTRVFRAAG